MRLKIKGTNKVLKVDIDQFHDAITFFNTDGTPENNKPIELPKISEEEEKALDAVLGETSL